MGPIDETARSTLLDLTTFKTYHASMLPAASRRKKYTKIADGHEPGFVSVEFFVDGGPVRRKFVDGNGGAGGMIKIAVIPRFS